MTYDLVDNTLKSLLLNNVKVTSKKRTLGVGQVLLYDIKDFNIRLFLSNNKKTVDKTPQPVVSSNSDKKTKKNS